MSEQHVNDRCCTFHVLSIQRHICGHVLNVSDIHSTLSPVLITS